MTIAAPEVSISPNISPKALRTKDATLTLQTRIAFDLWNGRPPTTNQIGAVTRGANGVMNACAASFRIWVMTADDNPLADAVLLWLEAELTHIETQYAEKKLLVETLLAQQAASGLVATPMMSVAPVTLEIGFGSPYGWRLVQSLLKFDEVVRHVLTLEATAILTHRNAMALIWDLSNANRRIFDGLAKCASILRRPAVAALRRKQLLDPAHHPEALKISQEATVALKRIAPTLMDVTQARDVLSGSLRPSHYKRGVKS